MDYRKIKTFKDACDALGITAMGVPLNEDFSTKQDSDDRKLKYVYCPVNGNMTVYDVLNNRVDELSGFLTIDKYNKIMARATNKTEFDGKKNLDKIYDRIRYEINKDAFPAFDREYLIATHKLNIVAKSINDGWEPDWGNEKEYKYYIYFNMGGKVGSGFAFRNASVDNSLSDVGSRLCFETRERAEHASKYFLEEYKAVYLIEKKKN